MLRIGSPSVHEKLLKNWDRLDLVKAARSAANIVAHLHKCNILMGDVNAGNFMVDPKDSSNVYVVDTDSFQLGGYPCPVGVEDFTHPGTAQRLGVTGALKYDTFLRTPDEENYVLAILIFKVLFLNQNPFVTKTKMTYREAMAAKKFSYALEGDDYEVPDGDQLDDLEEPAPQGIGCLYRRLHPVAVRHRLRVGRPAGLLRRKHPKIWFQPGAGPHEIP